MFATVLYIIHQFLTDRVHLFPTENTVNNSFESEAIKYLFIILQQTKICNNISSKQNIN